MVSMRRENNCVINEESNSRPLSFLYAVWSRAGSGAGASENADRRSRLITTFLKVEQKCKNAAGPQTGGIREKKVCGSGKILRGSKVKFSAGFKYDVKPASGGRVELETSRPAATFALYFQSASTSSK